MSDNSLPSVSVSTNFGTVKKIVWFEVSSSYGSFNMNFFITNDRDRDMNITIFNKGTNEVVFQKTYPLSPNLTTIIDNTTIVHTPLTMSNVYGIKMT